MLATRVEEVRNPRVKLAFDSQGRQFGEQGRMPDCMGKNIKGPVTERKKLAL